MPTIKKCNLTPEQLAALAKSRNNAVFMSPNEKFNYIKRQHEKKFRTKIRKFHFKAIEHGADIFLFNGIGKELGKFSNDIGGKRECRIFALYEIFLKTPEEKRQGGYKFDFCKVE